MRMLRLGLVVLAASVSTDANANCQKSGHAFCSKTFTATMRCNAPSGLASIAGNHCPDRQTCAYCPSGRDCPLIDPWEPTPIKIIGVELAVTNGEITWAFAGNNHVPDVMVTMGVGERRVQQWFPSGYAFSMPAAGTPGEHHIDLHVSCKTGWLGRKTASLFYTIYYAPVGPAPTAQSR